MAAVSACGADSKTETVESPSPIDFRKRPPCASTWSATISSWRTSAKAMAAGAASHIAVEPSMSDMQKVMTPVGSAAPQPVRSRSTSSPGVAGRRAGSVASPSRSAASSCSACSGSMPSQGGSTPVGGAPVSSAKAVAASAYVSLARDGKPCAASSGARNPGVPVRGRRASGADDNPKSTSLTRPPLVRIRFAGLTSPWMTGGSCECRCVSASAACARYASTLDGARPGRPRSRSSVARSLPSTQSIATT